MTREEAIKLLEHISIAYTPTDAYGDYDDPQPYEDALDMAIEALQADMYCPNCGVRLVTEDKYIEPTHTHGRLIDADALKEREKELWDCDFIHPQYEDTLADVINRAPTAQAEINCIHCPHYHETEDDTGVHGHCGSHGRLIDADALSKKLCETTLFVKDGEVFQRMINDAPTVQDDRPHGEWIFDTGIPIGGGRTSAGYVCSNCRKDYFRVDGFTFCPNCGSDMRKEKE